MMRRPLKPKVMCLIVLAFIALNMLAGKTDTLTTALSIILLLSSALTLIVLRRVERLEG